MIGIDFQGGAHGNFLEFVCNVIAGVPVAVSNPFNKHGASHNKNYLDCPIFIANHYSFQNIPLPSNRVIAIKIESDDLLPLSQISLLRAGDYGYDNNALEVDTYNKLNIPDYRWVLDNLLNSFFVDQIKNSYNAVKDESWPDVSNLKEFYSLPEDILNECTTVHNLRLLELTPDSPNCPRDVLREFFQIGFEQPEISGFITQQRKMKYPELVDVYNFPFSAFYTTEFFNQLDMIAQWAGINYNNKQQAEELQLDFLSRQPYKDSKIKCDHIVEQNS